MATSTLPELRRAAAEGSLESVYLVVGEEEGLRRRAFEALSEAFEAEGEGGSGLGVIRIDGASASLGEIVDEARSLPLFAAAAGPGPTRLVWASRFDEVDVSEPGVLEEYLQAPVEATCLVLEAAKLDKRRTAWKLLSEHCVLVPCEPPESEADLRRWIQGTVEQEGHEIEPAAVVLLLEMAGTRINVLEQELEKAMLFVGEGGRIRARDLEGLLGRSREHSVFELTDALVQGDAPKALRILNLLLDDGEEPVRILGMIAWITRQLVIARDAVTRGLPRKEAMQALGGRWKQRGKILDRARSCDGAALMDALADCSEADLFVKALRGGRSGGDGLRPSRGRLETVCRRICAA